MLYHYYCFVVVLLTGYQAIVTESDGTASEIVITVDVNAPSSSFCSKHKDSTFNSLKVAMDCASAINNNVLVNITSQHLLLESVVGFSGCSHIKIAGLNHTSVHCTNNASVTFTKCSKVVIEGISWNECGVPDDSGNYGQLLFQLCSNLEIKHCIFMDSPSAGVTLAAVDGNILVHNSSFQHNAGNGKAGGMVLSGKSINYVYLNVNITYSSFFNNSVSSSCASQGCSAGLYVFIDEDSALNEVYIDIGETSFSTHNASGSGAMFIQAFNIETVTINTENMKYVNNYGVLTGVVYINMESVNSLTLLVDSNEFINNSGSIIHGVIGTNANMKIINTDFRNNNAVFNSFENGALLLELTESLTTTLDVRGCKFQENQISLFVVTTCNDVQLSFIGNSLTDNSAVDGIKITPAPYCDVDYTKFPADYPLASVTSGTLTCNFTSNHFTNNAVTHNGMVYISNSARVVLTDCSFTNNYATLAVVCTHLSHVYVNDCYFISNKASGLYILRGNVTLQGQINFHNNSASRGTGIVIKTESFIKLEKDVTLNFTNNFALQYGGAIYAELPTSTCRSIDINKRAAVTFRNNSAGISGNSTYFYIPKVCSDVTDMFRVLHNLHCEGDDSNNGSEFSCKEHMSSTPTNLSLNNFVDTSVMLGEEINIPLKLTDFFGHVAEPTVFSVNCIDCDNNPDGAFELQGSSSQFTVISNSLQSVSVVGTSPVSTSNITIRLSTFNVGDLQPIELNFTLQLSACHTGFVYNRTAKKCMCFTKYNIIHCTTTKHGEIMRGYWFGFINNNSTPTLSNCPFNYCQFKKCNGSNERCQLEYSLSHQCHHYRDGIACGECATHYSLPYDATECVPSTECKPIYTVLVIILTVIYWLVIVGATFVLMSLNFKVSYLFSLIYFYSIVDLLLVHNLYISDAVFQVVTLLSSFAKLSPQFLGKLCLVEGLSGIDQQFIHYIHPIAVLFLLLLITVVARYSLRVSSLISSSVIRVICVLLLLSYTSIASTSLQLLRDLEFTDVDDVYTYSSPAVKYFHGRHALYASIAVVLEIVVGFGMPMILILDPFLSHKINLSRIRPILDPFQGGYKDDYRFCAGFYLVCRQIIFLIVQFTTVSNHDKMNFVLLVICAAIAMLHAWVQPYVKDKLNSLDEVVLISAVVIVGINGSTFSSDTLSKLIIGFVLFPLLSFALFILHSLNIVERIRVFSVRIRVFLKVRSESVNDTGALENYDQYDRTSEYTNGESQPLISSSLR